LRIEDFGFICFFNPQSAIRNPQSLCGFRQDVSNPPPLPGTQRPRLYDPHAVAHLARIILIVRQKPGCSPQGLFIQGMLHKPVDRHGNRLLHGTTGDHPYLTLTDSPLNRLLAHQYPISDWRLIDD
jgi:hypothetical protein